MTQVNAVSREWWKQEPDQLIVKSNPARVFVMKENREMKRQMRGQAECGWLADGWWVGVLTREKSQGVCALTSVIQERRNMP